MIRMNKKLLAFILLAVFYLVFYLVPAFAGEREIIVNQSLQGAGTRQLTSGGEFARPSGNFSRPSFVVNTGAAGFSVPSGEFNKPSSDFGPDRGVFSENPTVSSAPGEFSNNYFSLTRDDDEFSNNSFAIVSSERGFSNNSFTIASGVNIKNPAHFMATSMRQ